LEELDRTATIVLPIDSDFVEARALVGRFPDQAISLFDAVVVAVSQRLDVPVWTYDFHFDVLGAHRWYGGL
jgi:predicted nucleic acid-binding protein